MPMSLWSNGGSHTSGSRSHQSRAVAYEFAHEPVPEIEVHKEADEYLAVPTEAVD